MWCLCVYLLGPPTIGRALPIQSSTASVEGLVQDPSEAALADARVLLRNVDTGQSRDARSTSDGFFRFLAVPPGHYRLVISLDGFAADERTLELTLDERRQLRVTLSLARSTQSVNVVATDQSRIEPSRTSLGKTLTNREIEELPVPSGLFQDFTSLATLSPGIVPDAAGTGIAAADRRGTTTRSISMA